MNNLPGRSQTKLSDDEGLKTVSDQETSSIKTNATNA